MLRTTLIFCAMFMAVGTANAEPLKLTDAQMDGVTAGGLLLPNLREVFEGFDNPSPMFEAHPNFDRDSGGARSTTAAAFNGGAGGGATANKGPVNGPFGNEGPWSAHFASPVINLAP